MAERAFQFRTGDKDFSTRQAAGRLDDGLAARLSDHEGKFTLSKIVNDQRKDTGPARVQRDAVNAFTERILKEARVDDVYIIDSESEPNYALRIRCSDWPQGERVYDAAKTQLGTQYIFGVANGPEDPGTDAFDCSGLTQWAWQSVGIYLPHNANDQMNASNTTKVSSPDTGDLVLFDFNSPYHGSASHVGLAAGALNPGHLIDTRNPDGEPVAIRAIEGDPYFLGFWRPTK